MVITWALVIGAWSFVDAQDVPRSVSGFDRSVLRSMVHAADSLLRARQYGAAESAYSAVIAADSSAPAGHDGLASAILYNPRTKRNRRVALAEFAKATRLAPTSSTYQTHYGEALLPWRIPVPRPSSRDSSADSAQLADAMQHLTRALELNPRWAEPRLGLYLGNLAAGRYDEADAQLRELVARNYYPAAVLDFAWDLLISVDSSGFLFTNGDLDMLPTLALQAAKGLRPDVTVVNVSLLDVPWYVKYLKERRHLPVSFSDAQLETLSARYDTRLQRSLPPGLRVLLDAVESRGKTKGGLYFALTVDPEVMALFKRSLSLEGLVYRVSDDPGSIPVNRDRSVQNLTHDYRIPDFLPAGTWLADAPQMAHDYSGLALDCAAAFMALADDYRSHGEITRASGLLHQACSILVAARQWPAFENVLAYWLSIAPEDREALKFKSDYHK